MEASDTGEDVSIVLENAALWDAEHSNLYEAKIRLTQDGEVLDEVSESFGVRPLRRNSSQGLQVNGKTVKLRGGCVHHDNGMYGYPLYFEDCWRDDLGKWLSRIGIIPV